mmetsp:Transcript_2327/g.3395  ORF Transcript_2327/g.3395 Transcript_2327/m.3395 type:complete len:236 (+) Transcript_2327:500-1207(+)
MEANLLVLCTMQPDPSPFYFHSRIHPLGRSRVQPPWQQVRQLPSLGLLSWRRPLQLLSSRQQPSLLPLSFSVRYVLWQQLRPRQVGQEEPKQEEGLVRVLFSSSKVVIHQQLTAPVDEGLGLFYPQSLCQDTFDHQDLHRLCVVQESDDHHLCRTKADRTDLHRLDHGHDQSGHWDDHLSDGRLLRHLPQEYNLDLLQLQPQSASLQQGVGRIYFQRGASRLFFDHVQLLCVQPP